MQWIFCWIPKQRPFIILPSPEEKNNQSKVTSSVCLLDPDCLPLTDKWETTYDSQRRALLKQAPPHSYSDLSSFLLHQREEETRPLFLFLEWSEGCVEKEVVCSDETQERMWVLLERGYEKLMESDLSTCLLTIRLSLQIARFHNKQSWTPRGQRLTRNLVDVVDKEIHQRLQMSMEPIRTRDLHLFSLITALRAWLPLYSDFIMEHIHTCSLVSKIIQFLEVRLFVPEASTFLCEELMLLMCDILQIVKQNIPFLSHILTEEEQQTLSKACLNTMSQNNPQTSSLWYVLLTFLKETSENSCAISPSETSNVLEWLNDCVPNKQLWKEHMKQTSDESYPLFLILLLKWDWFLTHQPNYFTPLICRILMSLAADESHPSICLLLSRTSFLQSISKESNEAVMLFATLTMYSAASYQMCVDVYPDWFDASRLALTQHQEDQEMMINHLFVLEAVLQNASVDILENWISVEVINMIRECKKNLTKGSESEDLCMNILKAIKQRMPDLYRKQ